jgi:hypothetical protein
MNQLEWEADMDGDQVTMRDGKGRFAAGCSGNPAGKLKGTRNRATLLAEALREGEGEAVARIVIDKALAGNAVMARFCVALLTPKPRGRAIALDLPAGGRPDEIVAAFDVILAAMAAGEITPDEALVVTRVLEGRLRALKAWRIEQQPMSDGRVIPGDAAMADDAADDADDGAADAQPPPPYPATAPAVPASAAWRPDAAKGNRAARRRQAAKSRRRGAEAAAAAALSPAFPLHLRKRA